MGLKLASAAVTSSAPSLPPPLQLVLPALSSAAAATVQPMPPMFLSQAPESFLQVRSGQQGSPVFLHLQS